MVVALFAPPAICGEPAPHLLSGARHFREGRFESALVEFQVARQLGARGAVQWYLAATLTKLGRPEAAIETFVAAAEEAPAERDALLGYYWAIACYEAKLLHCASARLEEVEREAGPRISELAKRVRAEITAVLGREPPSSAIDGCLSRGSEAMKRGRPAVAVAYFEEAKHLAALRPDRHRAGEATSLLAEARRGRAGPGSAR